VGACNNSKGISRQIKEKLAILYGNKPGYGISVLARPLLDRKIQVPVSEYLICQYGDALSQKYSEI